MRIIYAAIPDLFIELVCGLASYLVSLTGSGSEESIAKKIRGSIVGRRFGGTGCSIGKNVIFVGSRNIQFGDDVAINAGSQFIAGNKGYITMGKGAHVSRNSVLAGAGGIEIGQHCKISSGVMIYSITYDRRDGELLRDAKTKCETIKIGNDVHIGANATILPGVTIGDNSIIGAGAVVVENVAPNAVMVGVPAKPRTS